MRPVHPKQPFRSDREIVWGYAATQDMPCFGCVANAVHDKAFVDVHRYHFTKHQPARYFDAAQPFELDDLGRLALKKDGAFCNPGGPHQR